MTGKKINVLVRSLGCRVNLADAAEAVDHLSSERFRLVFDLAGADVALLHTCTVTHKADRDVRKILGAWRRDRPDLPVIVSGCGVLTMPTAIRGFENVRSLVPPGNPQSVAQALAELYDAAMAPSGQTSPFDRLGRKRAIVKVQDGCNARCSYCVIPAVRGPERSLPVDAVVSRVARMLRQGHHEVVLSGIHLGRYGGAAGLLVLLRALAPLFEQMGPAYRLRLSSIEPMEFTVALMEEISKAPFVCHHFHVPLQSGDDSVLERMGRPYRASEFTGVIQALSDRFPDAALGTDVLVGFPGEGELAAENTHRLVDSLPLSYLHVFTFSPRPGTAAADMPQRTPKEAVRRRAAAVRSIGRKHWRDFSKRGLKRRHQVLIEKKHQNSCLGRTREYRQFRLNYQEDIDDVVVEVLAECLDGDTLVGVVSSQVKP